MPLGDREKLNRIEELKTKLFSRNYNPKSTHRDRFSHPKEISVSEDWGDAQASSLSLIPKFFMKTSLFKKFFIASVVFFLLAVGYASYVFFFGGNTVSNSNIDISVLGNNFTAGGEELSLTVGITNKNSTSLDLVDLIMEYPKDPSLGAIGSGTERSRMSLGTIPSGAVRSENLKLVLFGQQGSVVPIKISIEYRVEGSNAIFVKDKMYEVTISSTPISLAVDAPDTISPNQDITLKVTVALNATKPASKILLKLDYPAGFQFSSSTPSPSFGTNAWSLGDMAPGAERSILVTGKMVDVFDGEEKNFHASIGSQSSSDKSRIDVVFNSLSHIMAVKKSSIEAKLFINGIADRQFAVDTKTSINGQIGWTNNADTKIDDLIITAKISGNAFNRKTVNASQGFYNSADDTITWDKNGDSTLAEVNPGDNGTVNFSFSPVSLFSGTSGLLSSPSVNIDISVTGKRSVAGYSTEQLQSSESSVIRIISDVGLDGKALYYSGPFTNTGPIPPKVEKQTTYTITLSTSNTANNISKGLVRSTLPSWVRFVGTTLPAEEDLKYNASTREILWNIGTIPKGSGITGTGRSVSFQVSISPSLSQLGSSPKLINDMVLTGHDDFANVNVSANRGAINTALINDPAFPPNGATVTE